MRQLPDKPFQTADFSPSGGGIDFLGLRWVNLTIVGNELISELNNVTADMGTFFLGGWIPWKFKQLCRSEKDFTEKNYRAFREKVETAMSLTYRDESGIERNFGSTRNRIGNSQKPALPCKLTFANVDRTEQNSLYAAAVYGPVLYAFGFIKTYRSQGKNNTSLNIPIPGDDESTQRVLADFDAELGKAISYGKLASLDWPQFEWNDIKNLGEAGLDPARFRGPEFEYMKACFRRKLLPDDESDRGHSRTLTTRLLLATLARRSDLTSDQIRDAWYTGMFEDGTMLNLDAPAMIDHCRRWSCFMARQYQQYAIELFLWCFETAVGAECRSVYEIIEHWSSGTMAAGLNLEDTLDDLLKQTAGNLLKDTDIETSRMWNESVHASHKQFEYVSDPQDDGAVAHGLRMIAGWYWRIYIRKQDAKAKELLNLGGSDRMGMQWFMEWLEARRGFKLRQLIHDAFSDLIFSQHMRVALARFDGHSQRLRFVIGDSGIEPTVSARGDLGRRGLPGMPDRLDALASLLCDADVLIRNEGKLQLGPRALEIINRI